MRSTNVLACVGVLAVGGPAQQRNALKNKADALGANPIKTVHFSHQRLVPDPLNARQLRTGRFRYRTLLKGRDAGTSAISVREGAEPNTFVFSNHVAGQFSQQWTSVAGVQFQSISADLSFGEGDALRPAFELKYDGSRVTGLFIPRNSAAQQKFTVNSDTLRYTVEQR